MPHNGTLRLKVAGRKDFLIPALVISALVLISALFSPQPLLMTFFTVILLGAGWFYSVLGFSELTDLNLTSVIFPNGIVKLESDGKFIQEGNLSGQQWCNSQFAVLRVASGSKCHKLVLFSACQNTGDYRRLMVWLRQDLLLKK